MSSSFEANRPRFIINDTRSVTFLQVFPVESANRMPNKHTKGPAGGRNYL